MRKLLLKIDFLIHPKEKKKITHTFQLTEFRLKKADDLQKAGELEKILNNFLNWNAEL